MLGWDKLVKQYKDLQSKRKNYKITWKPEFFVDNEFYAMVVVPTIIYTPWFHVSPSWGRIIDISWLNFVIRMGKLELKEEYND